ncbi:MAG: element excision factor XisH family protein [Anaerolineae bacterium]
MPARDICHDTVKNALIKDTWCPAVRGRQQEEPWPTN